MKPCFLICPHNAIKNTIAEDPIWSLSLDSKLVIRQNPATNCKLWPEIYLCEYSWLPTLEKKEEKNVEIP